MKSIEPKKTIHMIEAMEFVWDILVAIAVPTTLFAYIGRTLDIRYDRSPVFVILGFLLALSVTYVMVKKQVKRYKKMTE